MHVLIERRITFAVIAAIAVVFCLAGWRYFNGETERPHVARPTAPSTKPVTLAAAPAVATAPTPLDQFEFTQQNLVDDLQTTQARVARQDAEIKRLRAELAQLNQRYDTLSSFASTPKEAKADVEAKPPKKKKRRFVRRVRVKQASK